MLTLSLCLIASGLTFQLFMSQVGSFEMAVRYDKMLLLSHYFTTHSSCPMVYTVQRAGLQPRFVPLRVGRNTYAGGRGENIPPSNRHNEVMDYFAAHFGLTERQAATLLGGETKKTN